MLFLKQEHVLQNKILLYFIWLTVPIVFLISAAAFTINYLIGSWYRNNSLDQFTTTVKNIVEESGPDILYSVDQSNTNIYITYLDPKGREIFSGRNTSQGQQSLQHRHEIDLVDEALKSYYYSHSYSHGYPQGVSHKTEHRIYQLRDGSVLHFYITPDPLTIYTDRMIFYIIIIMAFLIMFSAYMAGEMTKRIMRPLKAINPASPEPNVPYQELKPFLNTIDEQRSKIEEQLNKLRRRNSELRTVIRNMSDGLVLLNAEGNIITINNTAREILNVTNRNCIQRNYSILDKSGMIRSLIEKSDVNSNDSIQFSEGERDYEMRFMRIGHGNSKALGFALILLDITEKLRAEQLRQEFTANVSHELKTPLQSIIGYSELMESGLVKPEDVPAFAGRINRQSTRLKTLIEDIMLIAALDEGKLSVSETFDLKEICLEVFDNLSEKAEEHKITLKLNGNSISLTAVKRYIFELIYNLTDNAIRYNRPEGSVHIFINEDDEQYTIKVSDNGIGIGKSDLYRIFERFYRVDKSHSRNTGGTGLGLSIVKRVVLYHKGKISVDSTLGMGTSFTVSFNKKDLLQLAVENEERREQFLKETAESSDEVIAVH